MRTAVVAAWMAKATASIHHDPTSASSATAPVTNSTAPVKTKSIARPWPLSSSGSGARGSVAALLTSVPFPGAGPISSGMLESIRGSGGRAKRGLSATGWGLLRGVGAASPESWAPMCGWVVALVTGASFFTIGIGKNYHQPGGFPNTSV